MRLVCVILCVRYYHYHWFRCSLDNNMTTYFGRNNDCVWYHLLICKKNCKCFYLFSGAIWTLTGFVIVACSVEWHVFVSFAFLVIHFITFFNVNPVHLDGTARFTGHENFRWHHLTYKFRLLIIIHTRVEIDEKNLWFHTAAIISKLFLLASKHPFLTEKCQHGCTINRRSQAILSLHEKLTQLPWTRAILACQHVNSISVGRWSLSRKLAICWCNRSILFTNIHNKSKNNWMLLYFFVLFRLNFWSNDWTNWSCLFIY